MASAVQITVTLDQSGAIQGMNNLKSSLTGVGDTAAVAGKKGSDAFTGIEAAQGRAHIAARLFTQTLGVEMPRALERVIAHSQLLGPIFAGAFNVAVFAAAASALKVVYDKIIAVTEATAGYTEEVKASYAAAVKASEQLFINAKTIEMTRQHLGQVHDEVKATEQVAAGQRTANQLLQTQSGLVQFMGHFFSDETIQLKAQGEAIAHNVELTEKQRELNAQLAALFKQSVGTLEEQAALAGKKGFARIAEEQKQALKKFHEISGLGTTEEKDRGEAAIRGIYNAQDVQLARQNALELMKIQDQVAENTLKGEALVRRQEADHIKEFRAEMAEKLGISEQAVEKTAIFQAKATAYHQEAANRIKEIDQTTANEVRALQEEAVIAQLSDDDKVYAQQQKMVDRYRAFYMEAPSPQRWETYQEAIVAADQIAQAKIRANHEATAQSDAADLARRQALVDRASEDMKVAQENAALAVVPEWQRGTAQIEIELNRRLRAIQDEQIKALAANKLGDDAAVAIEQSAQARRLDAWVQADQRIREEQRRLADQLGSELASVFNDMASGKIGQTILNNMKKLFFEILAQWILTTKMMGGIFGQLFGSLIFGPGSMGAGVFGGGGGTGLLGLLGLGGSAAAGVGIPGAGGSVPFFGGNTTASGGVISSGSTAGAAGFGGSGGLLGGLLGGSTTSASSAGAASTLTGAAADALSTPSISNLAAWSQGATAVTMGAPSLGNRLGGLFNMQALSGFGALLPMLLGGMGGKIGMIGGMMSSFSLMGGAALLAHLGISGAIAPLILGPLALAGAGLLGFGLGQQHGGVLGSLGGAGSGALMGFLMGGPIGALIGGIIGLLGGIFGGLFGGHKRKKQANSYFEQQIQPAIKKIVGDYESFQLDYANATQQLTQLDDQAKQQLDKLRGEGRGVYKDKVHPAILAAEEQIGADEKERTRRAGLMFGPPQFHEGGYVNASIMSAWTTRPHEMLALVKDGEFVMNRQATATHRGTLEALNAGGGIARSTVNITINALDARSVKQWLRAEGTQMISDALTTHWYKEGKS